MSWKGRRKSTADEGNVATDEDIRNAYWLLLGREPDPAGLDEYRARKALGPQGVAQSIIDSAEFKDKHPPLTDSPHRIVQMDGFKMWASIADVNGPGSYITIHATWEPHVTAEVRRLLREGMTFVDCGANIGYFTLLGRSLGARVIAYEPNPYCFGLLLASAKINRYEVDLRPFGLSDRVGIAMLNASDSTGSLSAFDGDVGMALTRPLVYTTTLDHDLAGEERVDILKLDIDGGEASLVKGATETIRKHRPTILSEVHDASLRAAGSSAEQYLDQLIALGYEITVLGSSGKVECGQDRGRVMRVYEEEPHEYIDIVATVAD